MSNQGGRIVLIPTPIGNLGDITVRALELLKAADIIACEDTRTTGRLMQHFGLKKQLVSYHEFNERSRADSLMERAKAGELIAVVSDAGSPGISDPAYRIVRAAIDNDVSIEALPGPTALIPALTASGLPTDRFFYEGFLSNKGGTRRNRLAELSSFAHTLVFYESPHRIKKTLADMLSELGDRQAAMAREISKKFETYYRGNISEIIEQLGEGSVKGEIVLVIAGNKGEKRASK